MQVRPSFLLRGVQNNFTIIIEGICDATADAHNISATQLEEHFHARLYSFDLISLTNIVLLGKCHRYHCPLSSRTRSSQEEHLTPLCPHR